MDELTRAFNAGFSDYPIAFHANESYLFKRWSGARVQLDYSIGGWIDGELVAILMTGIDDWKGKKTAYNAATCVMPTARGNDFTQKAYDYLIPQLRAIGVQTLLLEVLQINERAIYVYKKAGFEIDRSLMSYIGQPKMPDDKLTEGVNLELTPDFDLEKYVQFIDFCPSWEHKTKGIRVNWQDHDCYVLYKKGEPIGYCILAQADGRVKQLFLHPSERNKGYEIWMMSAIAEKYPTLKVINTDGKNTRLLNIFQQIGLDEGIHQFEMIRRI